MDDDRPPETEAEYRLVHGPWPRWMLHLGLMKLALRAGGVVALCIVGFVGLIVLFRALRGL